MKPMMGHSLDLVVEFVTLTVDRLAVNLGFETSTIRRDLNQERPIQTVPGLASKDQLVEPLDEQVDRPIRAERDVFALLGANVVAVHDDVVEYPLGGGSEKVIEVRRRDAEANVSRMIERLHGPHAQVLPKGRPFRADPLAIDFTKRHGVRRTVATLIRLNAEEPANRAPSVLHAIKKGDTPVVEVGRPAPDFTLQDQNGQDVTLSKLKGKPVVLYFYPKDNTPGCTNEACAFRDARLDYEALGAKVLGVSPDSVATHAKFAQKFELPFILLADTDKAVCESYGVWQEKNMYGKKSMGVVRSTFVIDALGIVRHVFPKVKVDGHSDAVLDALKSLGS